MNTEPNIKEIAKQAEHNSRKIEENSYRISQNTGALEILHTIKMDTIMFFVMWIITFIMFLLSVGYIIYIKNDTNTIITDTQQEVEQENDNGNNNYIGRDGDINE
jgi:hypothetical protein